MVITPFTCTAPRLNGGSTANGRAITAPRSSTRPVAARAGWAALGSARRRTWEPPLHSTRRSRRRSFVACRRLRRVPSRVPQSTTPHGARRSSADPAATSSSSVVDACLTFPHLEAGSHSRRRASHMSSPRDGDGATPRRRPRTSRSKSGALSPRVRQLTSPPSPQWSCAISRSVSAGPVTSAGVRTACTVSPSGFVTSTSPRAWCATRRLTRPTVRRSVGRSFVTDASDSSPFIGSPSRWRTGRHDASSPTWATCELTAAQLFAAGPEAPRGGRPRALDWLASGSCTAGRIARGSPEKPQVRRRRHHRTRGRVPIPGREGRAARRSARCTCGELDSLRQPCA